MNIPMRFFLILFSLFILSCGGRKSDTAVKTGALTFGIKWVLHGQQKPADVVGDALYTMNCTTLGVSTISVDVKNSSGSSVASGGPWGCSAGSGTISAVPVGSNYTVAVTGKNSGGTITYSGQRAGVSITAGVTNDAGTIAVAYVGAGTGAAAQAGMVFVQQGSGGFYMGITEVTQEAYQRVVGSNPSHFTGCPTCPVEKVSWYEADAYCKNLGKRLPTETEWEYAATSGGMGQIYAGTSDVTLLPQYAWYADNSGRRTHPVGEKLPNGLGLYDMGGNLWEWTDSWSDITNTNRVIRGGSWYAQAYGLVVAYQAFYTPDSRYSDIGFRCAQ